MWKKKLSELTLGDMGRLLLWLVFGSLVWLGLWQEFGGC